MPETKETEGTGSSRGAIARLTSDPVSRRKFMALTGGSTALAAFLAACGSDSSSTTSTAMKGGSGGDETAQFGKGDIGILNYALTLEYLETAFYKEVIKSGLFKGAELETIKKFGSEEAQHVSALTAAVKQLGGTPVAKPGASFTSVIDGGLKKILVTAATVENLGAAAYLGQAGNIKNKEILAAALSIHSVEARHAAALNELIGAGFKGSGPLSGSLPDGAFGKPMDKAAVLAAVKPFLTA
jgi:rubrerythrin